LHRVGQSFLRLSYADRGAKYDAYGAGNVRLVQYLHNQSIAPGIFFAMRDRGGSFGFFLGNEYRFLHTRGSSVPMRITRP
jgi:hypothetical protein